MNILEAFEWLAEAELGPTEMQELKFDPELLCDPAPWDDVDWYKE